jgi:hypothetical protein
VAQLHQAALLYDDCSPLHHWLAEGGCGGERRLEPRNLETPLLQGLVAQLLGEKKAKMEQQEAR